MPCYADFNSKALDTISSPVSNDLLVKPYFFLNFRAETVKFKNFV